VGSLGITRSGRSHRPTVIRYARPTRSTRTPSGVNSNIENVSPMSSSVMSLARTFVAVPIRLSVPPSIEAYERGMRSLEGETRASSARSVTIGMNIATTGVLMIKPASGPVIPTVAPRSRVASPRVNAAMRAPSRLIAPVDWPPALRTYIARMVTVAGEANPCRAVRPSTPVHGSRTTSATTTEMAVTSGGDGLGDEQCHRDRDEREDDERLGWRRGDHDPASPSGDI
jgi:hypothetical protein